VHDYKLLDRVVFAFEVVTSKFPPHTAPACGASVAQIGAQRSRRIKRLGRFHRGFCDARKCLCKPQVVGSNPTPGTTWKRLERVGEKFGASPEPQADRETCHPAAAKGRPRAEAGAHGGHAAAGVDAREQAGTRASKQVETLVARRYSARRIRNYDAQPFAVYLSAGKLPDFALLYPADQPRPHSS
jgi:hypothetical protein